MSVSVIPASEGYLEAVEALERQCFSLPWTLQQLRGQLPDERHEFLLAVDEQGTLLGYIGMMVVLDEGDISNVAVAPEARRQGIGSRLVSAMLQKGEERKLAFITLEVREHNESAIALYEKYGFARVGLRKNYYEKPVENAILMTKFFSPNEE